MNNAAPSTNSTEAPAGHQYAPGELMTVHVSRARIFYFLFGFLWWRKRTWMATETGIVAKWGVVSRNEKRIPWSRITDKAIHQGLLARIFNYGTIRLETAGSDAGSEMVLDRIGNAERFYELICHQCDAAAGYDAT